MNCITICHWLFTTELTEQRRPNIQPGQQPWFQPPPRHRWRAVRFERWKHLTGPGTESFRFLTQSCYSGASSSSSQGPGCVHNTKRRRSPLDQKKPKEGMNFRGYTAWYWYIMIWLEAEGKGTKASEGKCGNVKRGVVVTRLFLWLARTWGAKFNLKVILWANPQSPCWSEVQCPLGQDWCFLTPVGEQLFGSPPPQKLCMGRD